MENNINFSDLIKPIDNTNTLLIDDKHISILEDIADSEKKTLSFKDINFYCIVKFDDKLNKIQNIRNGNSSSISFSIDPLIDYKKITILKFINCTFNNPTEFYDKTALIDDSIFNSNVSLNAGNIKVNDCIFKIEPNYNDNVIFTNCTFEKTTKKINIIGGKIEKFEILNATIKDKFYINKQSNKNEEQTKITNLIIKDTIFKENFKLHNCKVENIIIEDTDFIKNADFFKSEFTAGYNENEKDKSIYFKAINFESLALFGDTTFQEKLVFKYVTFKGHNHFINATLHKGLDLEYTNIQNEMNFYSLNILDTSQTSQETYRIIKHQFEKLGNKIEANKYHALELEQKKNNLSNEEPKRWLDYLVFQFHWFSSEHSTNWFLALLWILIVGFFSSALLSDSLILFPSILIISLSFLIFKNHTYSLIVSIIALSISIIGFSTLDFIDNSLYLKGLASNLSLFHLTHSELIFIGKSNDKLTIWQTIVMFFNKISLGYLYYQFLLSVRKDTRK